MVGWRQMLLKSISPFAFYFLNVATRRFYKFFKCFICLFIFERDRAQVGEGQRERKTEPEAGSRL